MIDLRLEVSTSIQMVPEQSQKKLLHTFTCVDTLFIIADILYLKRYTREKIFRKCQENKMIYSFFSVSCHLFLRTI